MNRGRPVYWHEGVFLRPQHFQQQDEYHEARSRELAAATRPHFWGVRSLRISPASLQSQTFEIEECHLLFPDGTLVDHPGNASLQSRSFEGMWGDTGEPLSVFLGLPKVSPEGINVGSVEGGGSRRNARYLVSGPEETTRDLYARGEGQPVLYLEHNLRLFFDREVEEASEFQLLKVAEVERFGSEVRLIDRYVPPLVHIGASPYLVGLLRDLSEQLKSRGFELAMYKGERGSDSAVPGSRDLTYLLGLMTLNRWIPLVHQHLAEPLAPPWVFYGLLRQIAGELSTFSSRYDAFGAPAESPEEGLPEYSHTGLGACFSQVSRVISRLLEELTAGPDFVVPLAFDGTYFYADLPERVFRGDNRYYLAVQARQAEDQLRHTVQTIAKLSSKEYLPLLIARALPGVPIEPLEQLPGELPRRPGVRYFQLDPHGPAWEAVRERRNAAIYFEAVPEEIEIELMVVYGK